MISIIKEFRINHSIMSWNWRPFQTTGNSSPRVQLLSSMSKHRSDILICEKGQTVDSERNRKSHSTDYWTPNIAFYCDQEVTDWRQPVWCVPLTPAHWIRRFMWCNEYKNWTDYQWGRLLFTDECRFSLTSDSPQCTYEESGEPELTISKGT